MLSKNIYKQLQENKIYVNSIIVTAVSDYLFQEIIIKDKHSLINLNTITIVFQTWKYFLIFKKLKIKKNGKERNFNEIK